jgi:hypothetical protein
MDIFIFLIGVIGLFFSLTDIIGQGILLVKVIGKKRARVLNIVCGILLITLSFFI